MKILVSTDCAVCGRPGEPSWGGIVLCENCYGTAGAVCSGIRVRTPPPSSPAEVPPAKEEAPGVC